jgi:hypothetical protein
MARFVIADLSDAKMRAAGTPGRRAEQSDAGRAARSSPRRRRSLACSTSSSGYPWVLKTHRYENRRS